MIVNEEEQEQKLRRTRKALIKTIMQ